MPQTLTYPGVYIEELPSSVRTIVGVATSVTAFVGRALRGPLDTPVVVDSFGAYVRRFGGIARISPMSYAVSQYFQNGGSTAIIVRVDHNGTTAAVALPAGAGTLALIASSPGAWGGSLRASVTESDPSFPNGFNLTIEEVDRANSNRVLNSEMFRNLSVTKGDTRFIGTILAQQSALVRLDGTPPAGRPGVTGATPIDFSASSDGDPVDDGDISDATLEGTKKGLYALEDADMVNLICIPPLQLDRDVGIATHNAALAYARTRRAVYLVDPPFAWSDSATPIDTVLGAVDGLASKLDNGLINFPSIRAPDPLQENRLETFAPCGVVAGVIARTDATRGVWKAPAGLEATLVGVPELAYKLTNAEHGRLNPRGVNCLRSFPGVGNVVWGARTLRGADTLADQWKYLSIRRTAYFIEETLFRNTQWVLFEPNDEPLWSQIRLNIGAFMQDLFQQGAFAGKTPKEAYLVKCDAETTPPEDVDKGVVNIVVGFQPLKPAEFVYIRIQQLAGQGQR